VKQNLEIISTDAGIQIECSEKHSENAHLPRFATVEPGANVKFESRSQQLKQTSEIA
jgi:hypothetical protein